MNLCCVFIRSIIVYLFFTFALMTFVQSPFINTCFGKPLWRLQSWTKLFLPQSAHNPSLEVHLWKEINTRQIEIGALTERSILEALEEGRLILAGAEHKWQMNIIQTQKIIYKFKMSPYFFFSGNYLWHFFGCTRTCYRVFNWHLTLPQLRF